MHQVCARINLDVFWSHVVLQVQRIPETTNLLFLNVWIKSCELICANMQLKPFEIYFTFLYSNHEMSLHNQVLYIFRIPMI
jgi:hypothetical protein